MRLYVVWAVFLFTDEVGHQADDEDNHDGNDKAEGDHHSQAHA